MRFGVLATAERARGEIVHGFSLVCHHMKIWDDTLDLDDGVTTPSTPLRGCVSGKGYGLIGLLAKAIKVAGQFVDMNIPATVSKYGG